MRILYNYWGHLSDKDGVSSADGNFSYSWSIINELFNRGHRIYGPPINRDIIPISNAGNIRRAFQAFSTDKRIKAYRSIQFINLDALPDIDILFLEWRFKTHYNQQKKSSKDYHPDLDIQNRLLEHYADKDVKLVILNLDSQLTVEDEWLLAASYGKDRITILEQSQFPKINFLPKKSIFIPFDMQDIMQFDIELPHKDNHMTYIGNDYNRRDDIEDKIVPYSNKYPNTVTFIGKWLEDSQSELREKWHNINFKQRIGAKEFHKNLKNTAAVPLLAPINYKIEACMTMRIIEAVLFGSIPIGFSDFRAIKLWLPWNLIVDINNIDRNLDTVMQRILRMDIKAKKYLREKLVTECLFMHDATYFVSEMLS